MSKLATMNIYSKGRLVSRIKGLLSKNESQFFCQDEYGKWHEIDFTDDQESIFKSVYEIYGDEYDCEKDIFEIRKEYSYEKI